MTTQNTRIVAFLNSRHAVWLAVWTAALLIRLIYLIQVRDFPHFQTLVGDAQGYDTWAGRLAADRWQWNETYYQAPLYPYFLSVIYGTIGHDLWAVRIIQCIMGASSCVLIGVSVRTDRYFSYRRDGKGGGCHMGFIGLRASARS